MDLKWTSVAQAHLVLLDMTQPSAIVSLFCITIIRPHKYLSPARQAIAAVT